MGLYLSEEERTKRRQAEEDLWDIERIADTREKLETSKRMIVKRTFNKNQHKNNVIKHIDIAIEELKELEKYLKQRI